MGESIPFKAAWVKVIHSGAGAITETDVMLADSSNAIILGFNVRPDAKAKVLAERSKVDVRSYRIIYDLLDDMQAALKGMLSPKYHEVYLGKCEGRQTYKPGILTDNIKTFFTFFSIGIEYAYIYFSTFQIGRYIRRRNADNRA